MKIWIDWSLSMYDNVAYPRGGCLCVCERDEIAEQDERIIS